jgi:hypothetical protein
MRSLPPVLALEFLAGWLDTLPPAELDERRVKFSTWHEVRAAFADWAREYIAGSLHFERGAWMPAELLAELVQTRVEVEVVLAGLEARP